MKKRLSALLTVAVGIGLTLPSVASARAMSTVPAQIRPLCSSVTFSISTSTPTVRVGQQAHFHFQWTCGTPSFPDSLAIYLYPGDGTQQNTQGCVVNCSSGGEDVTYAYGSPGTYYASGRLDDTDPPSGSGFHYSNSVAVHVTS